MALIICPECGSSVSSLAESCPHCAYPIGDYQKRKKFQEDVERLTAKILPTTFSIPEPRAKVCIKCGDAFDYAANSNYNWHDKPRCKCGFPGVEVDYPQLGIGGVPHILYIHEHDVVPRQIGDIESKEYKDHVTRLYMVAKKYKFSPKPPDPKYFGVYADDNPPSETSAKQESSHLCLPHCPFCSSTDLSKISGIGKAVKIWAFGLYGMDDAGKTYKCNNCGGKF